jgi:hypothetical protein
MTAMMDSRMMRHTETDRATYSRMCRRDRKGIWSAMVPAGVSKLEGTRAIKASTKDLQDNA